uniref:Venom allergen-like protein 1 n=1 Tax=Heterodera avenae TaxID=34510 RepID=A0A3Q8UEU8_HETAV|nr:venom allergen-like protein 1 [Heterodera avenae]
MELHSKVVCFFLLIALIAIPYNVWALSAGGRVSVLNCHNNYRSQLAKGTADNKSGKMPAGSNLIELKYLNEHEKGAQSWADGCSMSHSSSSQRQGMGENLYMSSSSTISEAEALKQACDMWWAELKEFGFDQSLVLNMNEFNKGIGHWSQQAWAKTAQIGCALARCPSSQWQTWVVCRYKAAGNMLNEMVYKKGTACSGCSDYSGASCNNANGLCVVP